jgi:hypothetical protein
VRSRAVADAVERAEEALIGYLEALAKAGK